jgi:hypothetical protein
VGAERLPYGCSGDPPCLGGNISASGIEKARGSRGGSFLCADAEQFVVSETYDVIIFNGRLYYLSDPAGTVARYSASLRPNGVPILYAIEGCFDTT